MKIQLTESQYKRLVENYPMDRMYIDWNENYNKTFRIVQTPEGSQSGEWTPDLVSIVTPENGDSWYEWESVPKEVLIKTWKRNWDEIQKSLGDHKYNQIIRSIKRLNEQVLLNPGLGLLQPTTKLVAKYPHEFNMVAGIATSFIPVVGPFIAAGIGAIDASLYYKEGDKTTATIVGVLSLLPFVGKIPGVRQAASSVWKTISSKVSSGSKLSPAELGILKEIGENSKSVQDVIAKASTKIAPLTQQIKSLKPAYVERYGQESYEKVMAHFLSGTIDKTKFISTISSGGKAAPHLTNFVTKFGLKFTKNEIDQIQKVINNVNSNTIDIVKLETKNGPIIVKVKKLEPEFIAKKVPDMTNSAGWANNDTNTIYINKAINKIYDKKSIENLFMHEFGHIKDPSIIKSPALEKLWDKMGVSGVEALKKAADLEKVNWAALGKTKPVDDIAKLKDIGTRNYKLHPYEITADNTMVLQNLSTATARVSEFLPQVEIIKALDEIINYAKGAQKSLSSNARYILGTDYPKIATHFETLSLKPSELKNLWSKIAQQSEYLKTQVKIGT